MLSYISFIVNTVLKTWNSFTIVFTLFTFLLSRDYFNSQVESVLPYLGYTLNKILITPFAQGTKFISFSGHAKVVFRVSNLFVCSSKCRYHASYHSNEASLFVLIDGFHCHITKKYIGKYYQWIKSGNCNVIGDS